MNVTSLEYDLAQMDQQSLEKIAQIADHARQSLLLGIATLRQLEITPGTPHAEDAELMVTQLSRLTLMWDEIHHRANQLLTANPFSDENWQSFNKRPPVTLH